MNLSILKEADVFLVYRPATGYIERCETCGECVDESEIRYDEKTNTTWCISPNCGE